MRTNLRKYTRTLINKLQKKGSDATLIYDHIKFVLLTKYNSSNYKEIPIIINNFNRLNYLLRLITSLESIGYYNIFILDNKSTYKPLLEYYSSCKYNIIYLNKNYGHRALWDSDVIKHFRNDIFIYTDPDLELINECPEDFMLFLIKELKKYPLVQKIGLSLKIDDLPDYFKNKSEVILWESRFYEVKHKKLYLADIDTTFAIHKPNSRGGYIDGIKTLRTPYPYQARHLPWYEDSRKISEENAYYLRTKKEGIGHWSSMIEV